MISNIDVALLLTCFGKSTWVCLPRWHTSHFNKDKIDKLGPSYGTLHQFRPKATLNQDNASKKFPKPLKAIF